MTTKQAILAAARTQLLQDGYARLSTRSVADSAAVPLSQVHYHFGGKQQLILSVLAREDERLLERQSRMYAEDWPLWQRYEQACDFLDEDLASGHVRVVQEMTAVGWTTPRSRPGPGAVAALGGPAGRRARHRGACARALQLT